MVPTIMGPRVQYGYRIMIEYITTFAVKIGCFVGNDRLIRFKISALKKCLLYKRKKKIFFAVYIILLGTISVASSSETILIPYLREYVISYA